ncbi:25370_t:CDS:2, partial [Racocetra persica]
MYMPLKDKTLNAINRKDHYLRLHSTKNSTSPDSSESVASALAKFFCIYDPRLMTSCDFLIWRTHNQVCLPVKDRQEEIPLFINFLRKYKHEWSEEELEKNCDIEKFFQLRLVDPRAFVNWCEDEYNTTLERKKLLPNKLVGGDIKRQETFKKYMYLQTSPSKWIITHNNEPIDIGRAFARTIVWDEIKMLEYDNPTLSFIIDLTQPQKKFRH